MVQKTKKGSRVIKVDFRGVSTDGGAFVFPEDNYAVEAESNEIKEGDKAPYINWKLKVIEGEIETVLDLMAELVLARPQNPFIVRKLATLLPESCSELKSALIIYASSLPELT